jgi:hypothetical protein
MASYIELHKTYERHLLANYGLTWAAWRYDHELKEHYLKMTPELWALRMKSVIDWNMHLVKEIIKCDLMIYRTDLANLRSLRREEDRQMYLDHMNTKRRELDTLRVIRLLRACIEYERLIYEVNTQVMPDGLFEIYERLAEKREEKPAQPQDSPAQVEHVEQKIISLEKLLKEVNRAERKKAA